MTNKIEASNGRGERGAAQGWIQDLGLDGALDEEPQPRHGKNEEPQRRVVARLRVPCPAASSRTAAWSSDACTGVLRTRLLGSARHRGRTETTAPHGGASNPPLSPARSGVPPAGDAGQHPIWRAPGRRRAPAPDLACLRLKRERHRERDQGGRVARWGEARAQP